MPFELNYDDAIHLDAEDLAEGGICRAYEMLLPQLRVYVPNPLIVKEFLDDESSSYSVACGQDQYSIYDSDYDMDAWGKATYAFFSIVNSQLRGTSTKLYAINGGNDLFGIFLTETQAIECRQSLPNMSDWPYLPTDESP